MSEGAMRNAKLDLPQFAPSPWTPWMDRVQIKGVNLPGVYVLARFKGAAPKKVDPADLKVIYVGETCDQMLSERWYQFGRSAFEEKSGHSGGHTYRREVTSTPRGLWVAAMGVALPETLAAATIRLLERILIWQYVHRHGWMPISNRK